MKELNLTFITASGSSFQTSTFTALNDVHIWQRNISDKTGQGMWLTPTGAASPKPSARLGHIMVPLSGSSSIIFGGFNGPLASGGQIFNDLWTLTGKMIIVYSSSSFLVSSG